MSTAEQRKEAKRRALDNNKAARRLALERIENLKKAIVEQEQLVALFDEDIAAFEEELNPGRP